MQVSLSHTSLALYHRCSSWLETGWRLCELSKLHLSSRKPSLLALIHHGDRLCLIGCLLRTLSALAVRSNGIMLIASQRGLYRLCLTFARVQYSRHLLQSLQCPSRRSLSTSRTASSRLALTQNVRSFRHSSRFRARFHLRQLLHVLSRYRHGPTQDAYLPDLDLASSSHHFASTSLFSSRHRSQQQVWLFII